MGCPKECGDFPLHLIIYLFVFFSFILAVIGGVIIFRMSKDETRRTLANAILLSGVTEGTLIMLFGMLSYGFITPFDLVPGISSSFAMFLLIFSLFTLGFGMGSITATAIGVSGTRIISKISARRNSSENEVEEESGDEG